MQKSTKIVPLPGIGATLAAGFDLTTKHVWLLILPVLLDSFYWLGPRLSFSRLFAALLRWLVQEAQQDAALAGLSAQLLTEVPPTNLFAGMSVPFVGVPALMSMTPGKTPLIPLVLEVHSW